MFRASQRPSSGDSKTVSATSGIGHGIGTAASFHRGLIRTGHLKKNKVKILFHPMLSDFQNNIKKVPSLSPVYAFVKNNF
jgi:hypothetical protein